MKFQVYEPDPRLRRPTPQPNKNDKHTVCKAILIRVSMGWMPLDLWMST